MLLPLLEIAVKENYDIHFKFIENKRNNIVLNFLRKISGDDYYLSTNNIKHLLGEFKKLPLNINNFSEIF